MRITIVTETYFPQVNGVSRTLSQLVRVLTEAGDAVQLLHPDSGRPPAEVEAHRVRSVPVPFYPEVRLPLPSRYQIQHVLNQFQPDLIHIATEATLGLTVLNLAVRQQVPVVSSFHTNFPQYAHLYRLGWSSGLIWRYLRWFHNRARETYVPSRSTLETLNARDFQRLVLWPRGVDAETFRPDRPGRQWVRQRLGIGPDQVVIASVGRLAIEKNVDFLAEALDLVQQSRPDACPLIVGDGPARAWLQSKLRGRARFVGYQDGPALADHYAAADLFAFASKTETFGNVVLEAMASGLPVLALAAGGPAELIQSGQNGLLLRPDATPDQFADALQSLVDAPERRAVMAESARADACARSWDAVMHRLRQRYLAVIARPTASTNSLKSVAVDR